MKIKPGTKWERLPMWKKRIHGFFSYLLMAVFSLLFPVEVDMAMRDVLNDQFTDD